MADDASGWIGAKEDRVYRVDLGDFEVKKAGNGDIRINFAPVRNSNLDARIRAFWQFPPHELNRLIAAVKALNNELIGQLQTGAPEPMQGQVA